MSRSRVPWLYRFVRDRQAQASPLGVVLVIGLVVVSTTVVVTFGLTAIDDVQSQSTLDRAESGMTLLDSQLSTVALGGAQTQRVSLPASKGRYSVDPTAGTVRVVHRNYSGTDDATLVSNTTLGAIVYKTGDASIAYQGGGVWRTYADGSVQMVSPPEFHYREGSLTFPIIRIRGSGNVSGATTVVATSDGGEHPLYPSNGHYPNGNPYRNPIENGTVEVIVHSEYADGWASYFRTRTDGNVSQPAPDKVVVELISIGTLGDFQMPPESESLSIAGMDDGHSLQDFSFRIRPQDTESSSFSNLDWSLYAKQGQKEFEIHVGGNGANSCGEDVALSIYYSTDGGNTHHGWYSPDYLQTECGEVNGKPADGDEIWVDVDLTNSSAMMNYEKVKNDNVHFKSGSKTLASGVKFDEHPADPGITYTAGDDENLALITRHYFAEMGPSIDLTVDDGNSAGIAESGSSGYIYYGGSGRVVTYLHITEHNVTARLN
ncbi:MAG: hypothetical protein ABEI80_05645 [Haloplanus sp.]